MAGLPGGGYAGLECVFLCPASSVQPPVTRPASLQRLLHKQPSERRVGQGLAGSGAQHRAAAGGAPLRGGRLPCSAWGAGEQQEWVA